MNLRNTINLNFNPMRKVLTLIIIGIMINASAQEENSIPENYSIDMFPKTPEAAALSKFVDIPAGSYTGVADFSIPLYTIEFDGGTIPIELQYTTTGIKVGELASRVGLGWTLNTGASLSQQVIGSHDVQYQKPILPVGDFTPDWFNADPNDYNDPYYIAMRATGLMEGEVPVDVKHDVFSYSLLNDSGKFIMDSGGDFGIPMPYNQIEIVPEGNTITITDEQGITYTFNKNVFGSVTNYNSCARDIYPLYGYPDPNFKISTIKSIKNREIIYTYGKNTSSKYVTSVVEQDRIDRVGDDPNLPPPQPLVPKCYNYSNSNDKAITQIEFDGGKVLFYYNNDSLGLDENREDIIGDVYLTRIIVKNSYDQIIKDFSLTYDYFTSSTSPSGHSPFYNDYMAGADKRLKLKKVKDNLSQGEYNLSYYDSYNNKTLPHRISNAQDYWGVYNGKDDNEKYLPTVKTSLINSPNNEFVLLGANKEPDINYGKLGNLKKITYPTGGYTEITYEADDYIKNIYVPPVYSYTPLAEPYYTDSDDYPTGQTFTIPNSAYNKKIRFYGETEENNQQIGLCRWDLYNSQNNWLIGGTGSGEFNRNDVPGSYKLVVSPSINNPNFDCYAEYTWIEENIVNDSETRKTGTIRVQKIESFDNNNGKIIRKYTYEDPSAHKSSGKNLGNEIFIPISTQKSPSGTNGLTATERILSNNPGWQTATVRGKPIGYDYVQELYISEDNPSKSYRKEYHFNNEPDDVWVQYDPYNAINYTWPVEGLKRGLLLEEKLFDSDDNLVKETIKKYDDNDTFFNTDATSHPSGSSIVGEGLEIVVVGNMGGYYEFEAEKFPIRNYWVKDTLTTTIEYKTLSVKLETKQRTRFSSSHTHTYPWEKETEGSNGETVKTVYQYPQDLIGIEPNMSTLKNANRLSTPVITESYMSDQNGTTLVSSQKTEYAAYQSGTLLLPKFIYLKKGIQSFEKKITYDRYDDKGNLEQYTMEDGIPVTVIWGYNKQYPIAKIENKTYTGISSTLIGNAVTASNTGTETDLKNALQALREGTDGIVTTYMYDPLVGVTVVIAPNGQENRYEYDSAGRLKKVLDQYGNVLKNIDYNYQH